MKTTITKEFQWDCAHRLRNPLLTEFENKEIFGLCSNIHGHTYKMFITVSFENEELENGMVMNFKDLKKIIKDLIVDDLDHSLVLTNGDPLIQVLSEQSIRLHVVPYESTCENQVNDFWHCLDTKLRLTGIILEKIKLYETPTSFATLTR